jgi:hypothetical protein
MTVDDTTFQLHILPEWFPAGGITQFGNVWLKSRHIGTPQGEVMLRHEAQHVRDQRKWHVLWYLSYIGLIIGFLSLRGFWEWRAYRITLLAEFEQKGYVSLYTQDLIVKWMSGSLYLWAMTPSYARKLVDREVIRLLNTKIPKTVTSPL